MTHWGRCSENCLQTITKYRLVKHSIGNWHFSTIFRSSHFDTNSRWNIVSQISRSNPLWAASHDLISSVAESTGLWYHIIGSAITIFYIIKIRILFGTCNSDVIGYLTHTHTHKNGTEKKCVYSVCGCETTNEIYYIEWNPYQLFPNVAEGNLMLLQWVQWKLTAYMENNFHARTQQYVAECKAIRCYYRFSYRFSLHCMNCLWLSTTSSSSSSSSLSGSRRSRSRSYPDRGAAAMKS